MTEVGPSFGDSIAYERFMGPWSRIAGEKFLDWLAPPANARWLDVGCGTGTFTQLVLERCFPNQLFAVDPVAEQIDYASRRLTKTIAFQVADAQSLPFSNNSFDIIASALVLNFIPDRIRALTEMRRVACPGGIVAAYVWDFESELSPSGPLRSGIRKIGVELPDMPGANQSSLDALGLMFSQNSLVEITTKAIDVNMSFADFDDFWGAQTSSYSPTTKMIAALSAADRTRLAQTVRGYVQDCGVKGGIQYSARANAIKARVPR